ncbi:SGNH/GDSL hydrolase family protein [Neobacillus sp. WH10]|uniref:SGNH/GDSL hydrolase family protein n=1 Tax=Neobacillus sp. WH10 TaxID=3047873 RepID=UPI0024C1E096|nr:SGNH/GDSL hydrolase family protein [Neobacillus sp. WH10]WHY77389.1 SGNH/GDSL hydrolase family protein [Neobacillus sp. WH10]
MKNLFTILLGLACAAVLFFGHNYWNERIKAAPESTSNVSKKQQKKLNVETASPDEDVLAYTAKWPESAVERFKQTLNEKKPFKVLFVGSPDIGTDTEGTFPAVKEKLLETFGENNIQVDLKTFKSTSTQLVNSNKQDEIAAEEADLIVLEPFILQNNSGLVLIDKTLNDTLKIMDDIKAKKPETTFILQPSYPLYQAKIYPNQVAELKKFAEQHQITYLDHWSAWPDANNEEIKEYLQQPDQSAPSDKGNQVWSDFILQFLISK